MIAIVQALRRQVAAIPLLDRDYPFSADDAERIYCLRSSMLDELVAVGFPHAEVDGERYYNEFDLHYVGLRLGTAVTFLWTMRQWVKMLEQTVPVATRVRIAYAARSADTPDGAPLLVRLPEQREMRVTPNGSPTLAEVDIAPRPEWPTVDEKVARILERVAELDFYGLPPTLRHRLDLVEEMRAGECEAAMWMILAACQKDGIDARVSYGLLLSLPYSAPHAWADVRVDDTWVPVDPLIVKVLQRFAGLDPRAWPVTRSLGGVLLRLSDRIEPIVSLDGEPVKTTFLTSVITATDPVPGEDAPGRA